MLTVDSARDFGVYLSKNVTLQYLDLSSARPVCADARVAWVPRVPQLFILQPAPQTITALAMKA